jgi:hypothetical protein
MKVKKWTEDNRNPIIISVSFVIIGVLIYGFVLTSIPEADIIELPDAPNVQIWGYDGGTLYLAWNNIFNATKYHVYQSVNNIVFIEISILNAPYTMARIYDLKEDSIYYFKITTEDNNGLISEFSNLILINTSLNYNFPS